METARLIVDLIGKIIWPICLMTIILIFRKHIIRLLPHITKVKAAGVELTIDKVDAIIEEALDSKFKIPDTPEKLQKIIYQTDEPSENIASMEKSDAGNNTLLAFTVNQSFNENLRYKIYYDPATRNHNSPFKYIGLYKDSEIFAVGKVLKVAYCDYENGELKPTNGFDIGQLNSDEYNRIKETIENTPYYELQEGCKFFIVDDFFNTHFIKSSNYPLRAKKYIWLNEIEGFRRGMPAEELAKLLDGKEWE